MDTTTTETIVETAAGPVAVRVYKSTGGFSGTWRSYSNRQYATKVAGEYLRTKAGAIRTFADRAAATKAGEVFAINQTTGAQCQ